MAHFQGSEEDDARSRMGEKLRETLKAEFERKAEEIRAQSRKGVRALSSIFATVEDTATESSFKLNTIGLMTADQYAQAVEERDKAIAKKKLKKEETKKKARKKRQQAKKRMLDVLSFADEDDVAPAVAAVAAVPAAPATHAPDKRDLDSTNEPPLKRSRKNPEVDTSFLPDRDRELEEIRERDRLVKEYIEAEEKAKKETVLVVYSYWDGSAHRREMTAEKGWTIGEFLSKVRADLATQFQEIRVAYSFYDLIKAKARGKSGPLFHFGVHQDIRLVSDVRIEKDESHPGKVITRSWYERNKHVFPASRWEIYDPSVQREEYTIRDTLKKH